MSVYVYVWYEPRVSHVHMRTGESFHDIYLISIFFWLLLFLFFNNRPFMSTKSCLYLEETRSFFVVYFQFLFFLLFVRFLLYSFFLSSRIMESFWCNHSAFCMLSVFSSDDRWRWSRWRGELTYYGWFYDRSHGYWTRLTRFNFFLFLNEPLFLLWKLERQISKHRCRKLSTKPSLPTAAKESNSLCLWLFEMYQIDSCCILIYFSKNSVAFIDIFVALLLLSKCLY